MTALATPGRSLEQRNEALQRANFVRVKRAAFKRDLKAGRASLPLALVDPPEWLESAKLLSVLLAAPKIGRVKANKILARCRISPSKTVGGISGRQRSDVVSAVGHIDSRVPVPASKPLGSDEGTQHMRALKDANRLRFARSQLKVDIATGERKVADILAVPPWEAQTMAIADLIAAGCGWGGGRTRRLLTRLGIPEKKTVDALTARQVRLVVDAIEGRPQPRPTLRALPAAPPDTATGRVFKAGGGGLHVVPGDGSYTACGRAFWEMIDGKAADWHENEHGRCTRCQLSVSRSGLTVQDA